MHIDDSLSLIDHRIYTIAIRKMPEFIKIFHDLAMPVLRETLGEPIGLYTSTIGPLNQFVHLWAYKDFSDFQHRCYLRDTHPDFPAYLAASGHLIVAQEDRLLTRAEILYEGGSNQ